MDKKHKTLSEIMCKTFSGSIIKIPVNTVIRELEVYNEPLYYKLFSFSVDNTEKLVLLTLSEVFNKTEKISK